MEEYSPLDSLSRDELIVLFEWSYRSCCARKLFFMHPAEVVLIDKIAMLLENSLEEPFGDSYPEVLERARQRVLESYEERMGKHGGWVHDQPINKD